MKYRILSLSFISCAFALSANAQTMVKEMENASTRFIPGAFMKNGEAAIYFSEDENGYTEEGGGTHYEARIFDFELNPLKSFNFKVLHPYTVTEKRASTGSIVKTKVIKEDRLNILPLMPSVSDMNARKSAFINWFYESNKDLDPTLTLESLTSNCYSKGQDIYISLQIQPGGFYQYPEYLTKLETYLNADDKWGFAYTYSTQVPRYDGEWSTFTWYDVPICNLCTPRCVDVASMSHSQGVYLPFSQTFFNDDEKFEYVRYKAEVSEVYGTTDSASTDSQVSPEEYLFGITSSDRDGDGVEDFRRKRFGVHYTGIKVVSEDGTTIYSFPIPDNCEGSASIEFFKSGNSILAQAEFGWYNENKRYVRTTRFYRIDKPTGTVKIIRDENRISASPNPANHGTPVTITLPDGTGFPRTISVTSLNGERIYNRSVNPEATEVSIPTHGFASGMYVLTLTENGKCIESSKIIIH